MLALGGEGLVRPWERKRAYSFLPATSPVIVLPEFYSGTWDPAYLELPPKRSPAEKRAVMSEEQRLANRRAGKVANFCRYPYPGYPNESPRSF